MKRAVVLGAGLAGLSAANFLRQRGFHVNVFEASPNIAGHARSESDKDGFTYDCGAHFITNRFAAAVGVSGDTKAMPRYGESVWIQNTKYTYPFGLMRSPKYVSSAIVTKAKSILSARSVTAADFYRESYGNRLSSEVAIPLTEAWSGLPAEQLSRAVGEKFSSGILRSLMLKTLGRLTKRTVAIGYSSVFHESPHVWHVYPKGGMAAICEKLAEPLVGKIQTLSPVQAIETDGRRVRAIQVKDQTYPADLVISTVPAPMLAKLVQGTDRLQYLAKFRYRAMVFVNVKLQGQSGLPDVVTWTPGKEFPFFRLSDIGMGLPWLVPEGKTQITCDFGCQVGDALWAATESDLAEKCLAGLEKIVPGVRERYLGVKVSRTAMAYPVFDIAYEEDRQRFAAGTGIQGLVSVGRNGDFSHALMEDVYWRTRQKIKRELETNFTSGV